MYQNIQMERSQYASEEHKMVQEAIDQIIQNEAVPNFAQWEKDGMTPLSFWKSLGEQGFLCMDVPPEYGGGGMDFSFSALILERLRVAGIDFGIAVHSDIVAPYVLKYGNEEQKQRFLPKMATGEWVGAIGMSEPSAGSDLKALKTTAVSDGDHYIINGSKTFITNGYVCQFVLCACRTNPGTPEEGISLIFIEKDMEGFTTGQPFEKIGAKAQDTCELFFEDVRVPKSNLLGDEGMGFKYMMTELSRERLAIAIEAVGSAQNAVDTTLQYVTERRAFKKALHEFQNTQFKLADCAADLQMLHAYIDHCIQLQVEHKLTATQGAIAKLKATELCSKIVDECLQLHGGYGFIWEYGIARNYASSRVTRIYGGTSEIMKLIVSRALFRQHYKK